MSYTPPSGNSISVDFTGEGYSAPSISTVDFQFEAPAFTGVLDAILESNIASINASHTLPSFTGIVDATLESNTVSVIAEHNVFTFTSVLDSELEEFATSLTSTFTAPVTAGILDVTLEPFTSLLPAEHYVTSVSGVFNTTQEPFVSSIAGEAASPPVSGDALDFNFTEVGYSAPSGASLGFDIGAPPSHHGSLASSLDSVTSSLVGTFVQQISLVAVGTDGKLATSADGVNWTLQTSSFGTTWIRSVAYGNGLWVAVGNSGKVATSADGVNWTQRTGVHGTSIIYSVAYGNGLWVAVGAGNKVSTSTNGINWTARTGGNQGWDIKDVAYGNGLWVAVGNSGTLSTSVDGITWTVRTSAHGNSTINGVIYDNGLWITVGTDGKLATSTDGVNWTSRTSAHDTDVITSVMHVGGLWITGGYNGKLATSNDGINWTSRTTGFGFDAIWNVTFSGDAKLWVIVGSNGKIATSPNGIDWTLGSSPFGTSPIFAVTSSNTLPVDIKGILSSTLSNVSSDIDSYFEIVTIVGEVVAVLGDVHPTIHAKLLNPGEGLINSTLQSDTANLIGERRIPISAEHSALYALILSVEHGANWGNVIIGENTSHYSLGLAQVANEHNSIYTLNPYDTVTAEHIAPSTIPITTAHTALYSPMSVVVHEHIGIYSFNQLVSNQFGSRYDSISPIRREHKHPYDLLSSNRVLTKHRSFYSLMSPDVVNITGQPNIIVEGEVLDIVAARVWTDEGDFIWQATIQLANLGDYVKLRRDMPFTLNIYGEHYNLIVDVKNLSRDSPANVSANFTGSSPGIKHTAPRSEPITKTFETAILASQAVEELLGGEVVDWQMMDWVIPAYRLAVEDADPIESAKMVIEAAGGVLESKKNGALLARRLFPVTIPDYSLSLVNHTYTDTLDNLSVSEQFDINTLYNRYRITDVKTEVADKVDFVPDDDGLGGVLRAYPSPWRTTIKLKHTWDNRIILFPLGEEIREEESIVEFTNGEGSTSFPILNLVSVEWMSQPLGGLVFDPYTDIIRSTHEVRKYGLARIKYKVKSINYRTFAPAGTSVQYVIEDLESEASLEVPSV